MLYVFNKLRRLNEEYIAIIDDNQITMKDFSSSARTSPSTNTPKTFDSSR